MTKCKYNNWIILHLITLVNSCIFINQIAKFAPLYINHSINPIIYFGFIPFITSLLMHVIYKYNKYQKYKAYYSINV